MAVIRLLLLVVLIGSMMAMAEGKSAGTTKEQGNKALAKILKVGRKAQDTDGKASKNDIIRELLREVGSTSIKDDDCEGFDTDSFCEWLINHPEEKRDFQAGRKAFKEDLSACESLIYGMTYIIAYDIHDADEVIGWFLGATKQYLEENC